MKTLVFALMVEVWVSNYLESTTEYGVWADVRDCVWFAELLSTQGQGKFKHPIIAYCVPTFRDANETEIY